MAWMKVRAVKVRENFVSEIFTAHSIVATASIEEYLTMVAGGLAGATPHMISATVTAISRLVFEFKGEESDTYAQFKCC